MSMTFGSAFISSSRAATIACLSRIWATDLGVLPMGMVLESFRG
jgi:hypothetical protein